MRCIAWCARCWPPPCCWEPASASPPWRRAKRSRTRIGPRIRRPSTIALGSGRTHQRTTSSSSAPIPSDRASTCPAGTPPAASIRASRRIGSPYGAPRTVRTTLSGILCRELQELSILIFRIIRSPPENIMFMYIIGIRHRIYARPNSESRVILLLR